MVQTVIGINSAMMWTPDKKRKKMDYKKELLEIIDQVESAKKRLAEVAEDVKFKVEETGEIQHVVMKDAPKKQPETTPIPEKPTTPDNPTNPTTPTTGTPQKKTPMSGKAQEAQVPGLDRGRFPIFSAIVSQ